MSETPKKLVERARRIALAEAMPLLDELADALTHAQARCAELDAGHKLMAQQVIEWSEIAAEEKLDASRYRWLREGCDEQQPVVTIAQQDSWGKWHDNPLWGDELDAAIDAALKEPR